MVHIDEVFVVRGRAPHYLKIDGMVSSFGLIPRYVDNDVSGILINASYENISSEYILDLKQVNKFKNMCSYVDQSDRFSSIKNIDLGDRFVRKCDQGACIEFKPSSFDGSHLRGEIVYTVYDWVDELLKNNSISSS